MMKHNIINLLVVAVISCTSLFIFSRWLFPTRSFDFCTRIVATVHAVLAVALASRSVVDWSRPIHPLAAQSSYLQMHCLAVTVGYLIYDLICCFFDTRVSIDNAVHHIVSIVGLGSGLVYERCGTELVTAIWITENSGPLLHLREMIKEIGYRDTDLNLTVDVAFALVFSVARMVGGPYQCYATLSADNPFLIKAMALGLQLISVFWFFNIVRMVEYKLIKRTSSTKKKRSRSLLHLAPTKVYMFDFL